MLKILTRRPLASAGAALAVTLTTALSGTLVPSAYADSGTQRSGTVTVTWPDTTAFNPTTTTYVVHVDNQSTNPTYITQYGAWKVEVPPGVSDTAYTTFHSEGQTQLDVRSCSSSTSCTVKSASPTLSVYSTMHGEKADVKIANPHDLAPVTVHADPVTTDQVSMSWTVTHGKTTPTTVATGTVTATRDADGGLAMPWSIPEDTPDGTYHLAVALSTDTTVWGHLDGQVADRTFVVDGTPDPVTLRVSDDHVFPVADGYRDHLYLHVRHPEAGTTPVRSTVLSVVDAKGHTRWSEPLTARTGDDVRWSGRDDAQRILPDGTYAIHATTTDAAGNVFTTSVPVTVSGKHLAWKTFKKVVTPKATLADKSVGSCSKLVSPSSHGWSGSIGLYSQTSCTRHADSYVVTSHVLHVPVASTLGKGRYRHLVVTFYGGHAVGTAASAAYVNGLVKRPGTGWDTDYYSQTGTIGTHAAVGDDVAPVFSATSAHPYVVWGLALTDGSRYDVKSFTVTLKYRVLTE